MKKLMITAVLAFCALQAQAQDKLSFGVKGGLNLATLTGDYPDGKVLPGAHIGGLVEYKFTNEWSVQPELLFSMQGAASDYFEEFSSDQYSTDWTRLNYINVPVMIKYHFSGVPGLSVGAGPQIGFLLSAKQKGVVYDEVAEDTRSRTYDVKDFYNKVDVGLALGGEYQFKNKIFAGIRGNFGLMDVAKGDGKANNLVLQLSGGYRF